MDVLAIDADEEEKVDYGEGECSVDHEYTEKRVVAHEFIQRINEKLP
jgi:hypothetical protein